MLPANCRELSNSAEFAYTKLALETAVESSLSEEQKQLIHEFYWQRKTKTEIAESRGVVHSTIVKRIKAAEEIIKAQVDFAMKLYKNQRESQYLS